MRSAAALGAFSLAVVLTACGGGGAPKQLAAGSEDEPPATAAVTHPADESSAGSVDEVELMAHLQSVVEWSRGLYNAVGTAFVTDGVPVDAASLREMEETFDYGDTVFTDQLPREAGEVMVSTSADGKAMLLLAQGESGVAVCSAAWSRGPIAARTASSLSEIDTPEECGATEPGPSPPNLFCVMATSGEVQSGRGTECDAPPFVRG